MDEQLHNKAVFMRNKTEKKKGDRKTVEEVGLRGTLTARAAIVMAMPVRKVR